LKEFWDKRKAEIGLAILVIYTLTLGVATADELFHLGLFPTKLDRLIATAIDNLDSSQSAVREDARRELIQYGDFAVPALVGTLDSGSANQKNLAMEILVKITDQEFDSAQRWQQWYQNHKDEF